jgi:hypothetical protein
LSLSAVENPFDIRFWLIFLPIIVVLGILFGQPVPKPKHVAEEPKIPTRMEKIGHSIGKVFGHGARGAVKGTFDGLRGN